MKRKLLIITLALVGILGIADLAQAQTKINLETQVKGTLAKANGGTGNTAGTANPPVYTVATLPGSPTRGDLALISDGASATDCTTGSGTTAVICQYSGSAWAGVGGSSMVYPGAGVAISTGSGWATSAAAPDGNAAHYLDGTGAFSTPAGGSSLPTATQPGQIITSTAAGTTYAVQPQVFYSQSGDTIASIESECSSLCTYVVTIPQTFTLASNHTLASNVKIEFKAGGEWTVNGSFTLTIPNNITGPPTQHFAGTSTIRIGTGTSTVYAEWWGAVGDGTTDDYTPTEDAIQSLYGPGADGSNDGHGAVQLLAKTYKIGTGLTITHGGVSLLGVNESLDGYTNTPFGSAITTASASLTEVSISGISGTWATDNALKNVTITRSVQPTGTATGVSFTYLFRTVVDHVFVVNSIRMFYIANVGAGGSGIIEHCNTSLSSVSGAGTYYGFYVDESGSNTTPSLKGNYNTSGKGTGSPTTTYGFYATGSQIQDIFWANYETSTLNYGKYLNSTGGAGVSNSDNVFRDNIDDSCLTTCDYVTGMSSSGRASVLLSGGRISTNTTAPAAYIVSSNGVMLEGVSVASAVNSPTLVEISGGSGNGVIGNTFDSYGSSGTYILLNSTNNNIVANNRLHGNSGTVAASLTTATYNILVGNTVGGTFTTGFSFDSASSNNSAYPNIFNGTITTAVSDSGTANNLGTRVNTATVAVPVNFSSTTPAAPGGNTNVTFQKDSSGNVSAYIPNSSGAYNQTIEQDGTPLAQEPTLDLINGSGSPVSCADDSGTSTTKCTFTGGSGSGDWTNITGAVTATGCTVGGGVCTVSTPGSSVDFSSIPGTYNQIKLVVRLRMSDSALAEAVVARFNGDSGSNYDQMRVQNSTANPGSAQTGAVLGLFPAATASSNSAGSGEFLVPFYAGTTFYKTLLGQSGYFETLGTSGTYFNSQVYNLWRSTTAITQITVVDFNGGNFVAGSSFSLYGVN